MSAIPEQGPVEADEAQSEVDSALGGSIRESLTSLRSSILAYQEENGRTYHALSAGKYMFPNDDSENDRLDLQHHVSVLAFEGRIALCPKAEMELKNVLDVGTGTGIWAMEFADAHPEANIIGVDLSPIQPTFVPPNCHFEIDDLEKEWTWATPFDFIFARHMVSSFADYQAFVDKAFQALEPGGYLEMQDAAHPIRCDDGTFSEDSHLYKWSHAFVEVGRKTGRRYDMAPMYKEMLLKAGFVDVVERVFRWPVNPWAKDKKHKEIGVWALASIDNGLEGLSLANFTRMMDWTKEEVLSFCAKVRKDLRNQNIHAYWPMYVVYGRKPDPSEETKTTR